MSKKDIIPLITKYSGARKARHLLWKLRNRLFEKYYDTVPVNNKLVVFESYLGRGYACSPRAIYEYMIQSPKYDEYSFVWAFNQPEKYTHLQSSRTKLVKYRSLAYYLTFARSKYWIVNGWISNRIKKKSGQIMVQCWHGTPLKRLRNDIIRNTKHATLSYEQAVESNTLDTVRYDYFVSPSRFASGVFMSAFDLKRLGKGNILIETGYPRNDYLYNFTKSDVAQIKQRLDIPKNKKVILYAPTWRDDQYEPGTGFTYNIGLDFDKLRKLFSKEYIVLFRAHYNIADNFNFNKYKGFIRDVSSIDEVNELYVVSDVLITDYSSVFFDYANLHRPILFYMYDLEYYEKELRGFYFDLDELPGPIIRKEEELHEAIGDLKNYTKRFNKKYKEFNKRFNYLDDGNAAERVVKKVIQ